MNEPLSLLFLLCRLNLCWQSFIYSDTLCIFFVSPNHALWKQSHMWKYEWRAYHLIYFLKKKTRQKSAVHIPRPIVATIIHPNTQSFRCGLLSLDKQPILCIPFVWVRECRQQIFHLIFSCFKQNFLLSLKKMVFRCSRPIVGSQCGSRIAGNLHNWSHIFIVVSTQQKFKKKVIFIHLCPLNSVCFAKIQLDFYAQKRTHKVIFTEHQ